jgi:DNA-binding PadR family transcriptional regulator
MPLHHAVLALLSEGPSYGYELKTHFEQAIGPQWGGLNVGHLYQILERLERDGHVSRSHVSQSSKPDKTLYTLTDSGSYELRRWAAEPCQRVGFRDELFLKLLGASRLGTDALAQLAAVQRTACLSELGALARLRAERTAEPLVALLVDAAIAHTKADLEVVEAAIERLGPMTQAARPAPTGVRPRSESA